ncbi:hypothetical protein QUF64_15080 [Anaerolineales bacterium HSG6]|nr:hypothetical protein [Anaerolineales bacterium HSG6]
MKIKHRNGIFADINSQNVETYQKSGLHLPKEAIMDADCIVTAMLLGLCREYVGGKKEIILTVEHPEKEQEISTYRKGEYERTKDLEALIKTTAKVNAALKTLNLKSLPDVKYGYAPWWAEGAYITGKKHGKGIPQSLKKDGIELVGDVPKEVGKEGINLYYLQQLPSPKYPAAQYTGRGAYTGVHIMGKKRMFLGSTFRHGAAGNPGTRWVPKPKRATRYDDEDKEIKPWGMIQGQPVEGMEELKEENDEVVGYTHGMIQAIYSAAVAGFKGQTIEVAVGEVTKKMASCFACTTFMCAADRPPDAIHLGRGESWMPIYAGTLGSDHLCKSIKRHNKKCKQDECDKAITYMNDKWHKKCASWLYWGSTINAEHVTDDHKKAWNRLVEFTKTTKGKPDNGKSANLFLDALTVHDKDSRRVDRTLK